MTPTSRVLLISDIESLQYIFIPQLRQICLEHNVDVSSIDYFFDWCINQSLIDLYNVRVINHFTHDIYKTYFALISFEFKKILSGAINKYDIATLSSCDVKTLINGRDLFITRRVTYSFF